jgi:polysaccharide pyruvyl transferase WcaK-like protein
MTPATTWPAGRPRVLVTDAWLANAGDAALALATEAMIRAAVPGAAVLHAAYHGTELGHHLPSLRCTLPLEELLGTPWAPTAPGWEASGPALVAGADAVVSQGGGFLVEAYQPWGRIAALATVARRGTPLAIVGQTIGRFEPADLRRDLEDVMAAAALVAVRDAPSARHARDLGAGDVVIGSDLAFGLFPDPPQEHARHGVGLVLTDHHPEDGLRSGRGELARHLAETVVDQAGDQPVTLWSTVQGHPELAREDDSALARSIVAGLSPGRRSGVTLVSGYVPPDRAIALVAGFRSLVSMRMHPALFAASLDTPFALVLGGQRTGVLAGTSLEGRLADPADRGAVDALVQRTLGGDGGDGQWEAVTPLRRRCAEVRGLLVRFLRELPPSS